MDLERRVGLVKSVGEEIVTEEELRALLAEKAHPVAYDGFEPSGTIHIAQGLLRAINVNKMTAAGCRFKMFVADWHAWANNKMGGDLDKIQTVGRYLQEIWRATGMDLDNVEFVWASELVQDEEYWKKVMNIARDSTLDRVLRTTQIMGRSEKDKLSAAQILYPCMQAADIFHLKADITQLGMDQRKINMLAREVGPKLGLWKPVVVSHHMLMGLAQPPPDFDFSKAMQHVLEPASHMLSDMSAASSEHHVDSALMGLLEAIAATPPAASWQEMERAVKNGARMLREHASRQGGDTGVIETAAVMEGLLLEEEQTYDKWFIERQTAMKMSKSNPNSSIFMTDTPQQVEAKLKKAYCPPFDMGKKEKGDRQENPVLEYFEFIIFQRNHLRGAPEDVSVVVPKPKAKGGGEARYAGYPELERAYAEGEIHPMDLKATCARYVNEMMGPVRAHFEADDKARALKEQVESFKVTR